jgi:hypothetical protein
MTTKLTLTIDENVVTEAKQYAAETGNSLSEIVEAYLKSLHGKLQHQHTFSPAVQGLKGILSVSDDFDYKKALADELVKKNLGL